MKEFESVYKTFLQDCHDKNLRRHLLTIEPESAGKIKVDGKIYLNFASNDYLGLKHHPKLIEESAVWAQKYGSGSGASRLVTGNFPLFAEGEQKIARLKGTEAALILASGYQANGAVLHALFDKTVLKQAPVVVSDKLNHASMHFGCAAANVRQKRYRHLDASHADELLQGAEENAPKFLLTETVFSMDGDVAPMSSLLASTKETQAMLVADDAHGFGVLGEGGKGLATGADLTIGTFSKALGSFGAYVSGSQTMIDYLTQRCGGLIYSTGLPPATLGAINAGLDLLPDLEVERKRVANHAKRFREEVAKLSSERGWSTGRSETQIVPLIIGDAKEALDLSTYLKDQGLWVTAIRPPTVPDGTARLRFAFTASHDEKDIAQLIDVLKGYK
jgi:8-amino-7-oxononanoate synthase